MAMVDILTVAFESSKQFLPAEVKGVCPGDAAVLQEKNVRVGAGVLFLKETVVEAGINHELSVVQVEGVRDGMLVQEDLLLVFAEVLSNAVEVDDTIVDRLLVGVVLADA